MGDAKEKSTLNELRTKQIRNAIKIIKQIKS